MPGLQDRNGVDQIRTLLIKQSDGYFGSSTGNGSPICNGSPTGKPVGYLWHRRMTRISLSNSILCGFIFFFEITDQLFWAFTQVVDGNAGVVGEIVIGVL